MKPSLFLAGLLLFGRPAVSSAAPFFSTTTINSLSGTGISLSLAIAADNSLHMAYYSTAAGTVLYSSRSQTTNWGTPQIVGSAQHPPHLSLALGADGAAQLVYFSSVTPCAGLCHAKFTGGAWTVSAVDSVGRSSYTSLAVDAGGNAHVAYSNASAALKYARYDGTSWTVQTVDSSADLGPGLGSSERFFRQVSLALDAAGNPRIAYFNDSTKAIRYVEREGSSWKASETVETVGNVAAGLSLAVNGSSAPRVSYVNTQNNELAFASKSGTSWTVSQAVSAGASPQPDGAASMVLGGNGNPLIAFNDNNNEFGVTGAGLATFNGTSWSTRTIDHVGGGAPAISLALDSSGDAHVLYGDPTAANPTVKYASSAGAGFSPAVGSPANSRVQAPTVLGALVMVTSITWSWTDNTSNETGFRLYGAQNSSGPYVLLATAAAGAASVTESNLFHSTTYYRYIAAVSTGGVSVSSISAGTTLPPRTSSATTGSGVTTVYAAPYGNVTLTLPADSFSAGVGVQFSVPTSFLAASGSASTLLPVGVGVEISFNGGIRPSAEALLSICYSDKNIVGFDESRFLIARYDSSGPVWVPLPSSADPAGNCVSARTSHFSIFQIMQAAAAASLDRVLVFPNPLRPSQGHTSMTFANLPAGAVVHLMTEQGQSINRVTSNTVGIASWNGKNSGGEKAASGVYWVRLESGSERKTIRVAVQR